MPQMWIPVLSPSHPTLQVLTVDARNHGDSPHSPDMSYEAMSQDLQDLLPKLGLVPCVLIGHSMGGKTAMLLALQRVSGPYPGLLPIHYRGPECPAGNWDSKEPRMAKFRIGELCLQPTLHALRLVPSPVLSHSQSWWSVWLPWTSAQWRPHPALTFQLTWQP